MARVIGIGGIFFKAKDPTKLAEWYSKYLGIEMGENMPMSIFQWKQAAESKPDGSTVWSLFPNDSDYFGSDERQFMLNYVVDDLDAMMEALKAAGVEILRPASNSPYGRFAAVRDPEGNGIELWQAADSE